MTNLELAQQQGNQAAPNLLAAATAGELGGGDSLFPSLSTAGYVTAEMVVTLSSDQADEAVANTIYANYKLVTDNHLDFFTLVEKYTDGSEGSETSQYIYIAFSARSLARIKNLVALEPEAPAEFLEILDSIEPDELCTFDFDEIFTVLNMLASESTMFGLDELPSASSGAIRLTFEQPSTSELVPMLPLPEGSSVYKLEIIPASALPEADQNQVLTAISYYAESLLDMPTKLDKTYYMYPWLYD